MKIICFLLCFFSVSVSAEKFHIVVGLAKPPYVIQDTNSGYEIEMIEKIMASMGKTPSFVFVPFGRSIRMLNSDRVDSIMTVNTNLISDTSHLSDTYIIYQNVVITLKEKHIVLKQLNDLSKISVAAFQNANKILGEDYAAAINQSPSYVEVANQKNQTKMLFDKKIDALVMDINIFNALSPTVGGDKDYLDVDVHYIFPKSPYKMAFKNKENIAPFNLALRNFKLSDDYIELVKKYNLKQ